MAWFKSDDDRAADALLELYREFRRLARQLEEDADRAPYAQFAERLREIVAQQERSAVELGKRLAELGRNPVENGAGPLREGRSSWDRLRLSLEEYRLLIRHLSQLKARWAEDRPADANLVGALRDRAVAHREVLVDLLARSDPHALN